MWDWASFASGLVGAVSGGGVTLLLALLGRRDRRRADRAEAIAGVVAALHDLSDAAATMMPPGTTKAPSEVTRAWGRVATATVALEAHCNADDPIPEWALLIGQRVMFPKENGDRAILPGLAALKLTQWHLGRLSPLWFAEDSARRSS